MSGSRRPRWRRRRPAQPHDDGWPVHFVVRGAGDSDTGTAKTRPDCDAASPTGRRAAGADLVRQYRQSAHALRLSKRSDRIHDVHRDRAPGTIPDRDPRPFAGLAPRSGTPRVGRRDDTAQTCRLVALSLRFEYLCKTNAVLSNPVKGGYKMLTRQCLL